MRKHAQTIGADQLDFDALLAETDMLNEQAAFARTFGHLPATMEDAVPHLCDLIARHHLAMLDGNAEAAMGLRKDAHNLALRLNNGEPGILAGPDAPGCKLARATEAPSGTVPVWGQQGSFVLDINGIEVRVELDGLFGIGASFSPWMNFAVHAVDPEKPFLSETGYRSFMGLCAELVPGLPPQSMVRQILESYIKRELKGRLRKIEKRPVSDGKGKA